MGSRVYAQDAGQLARHKERGPNEASSKLVFASKVDSLRLFPSLFVLSSLAPQWKCSLSLIIIIIARPLPLPLPSAPTVTIVSGRASCATVGVSGPHVGPRRPRARRREGGGESMTSKREKEKLEDDDGVETEREKITDKQ